MDHPPDSWNDAVAGYSRFAADCTRLFAEDLLRLAPPRAGERGLDLAAGTGVVAMAAARAGARVTAVDRSAAMASRVAANAVAEDLERLSVVVQDGNRLGLADGAFDVVWSLFGVTLFEDPRLGLAECRRVLGRRGRLAIGAWSTRQDSGRVLIEALARALPERPAPTAPPCGLALCDRGTVGNALSQAGFDGVTVVTVRRPWIVESARAFWDRLPSYSPASAAGLEGLRQEERAALGRQVVHDLVLRFGEGPVVLETEAHLAIATA